MESHVRSEPSPEAELSAAASATILTTGKGFVVWFSALAIAVLATFPAYALTGAEVMRRSLAARSQGDNATSTLRVELREKSGAQVTRTVETYRRNDCDGSQRQLVVMREPADVAGAAFLSWIHADRYPDMWLYLPELGKPRQLNPATRGETFLGSDFTYEDLGAPARDDRTHEIIDEPFIYGEPAYEVESIPRAQDLYSRIVTWVSRATFLPLRVEYYGTDGELIKAGRFRDVRIVNGIPTPFALDMEDVRTGHRTVVTLLAADFDRPFDCALFTERGLLRGAR
jgi:hypothetical protein